MRNVKWIVAATVIASALATPANAAIRRVDHNSPANGPGDAQDWSNAYNNLTDALSAASGGDVLWVADGTYKPINQSSSFVLKEGVRVLAGFGGIGVNETLEEQRNKNPVSNGCVLSGDISGNDIPSQPWVNYGDNCFNVVKGEHLNHPTLPTELDAFTIRGGNSVGFPGGGGIQITNSTGVRILRCRVIENQAQFEGGGIKLLVSSGIEIRLCEISDNRTTTLTDSQGSGGGGIDTKSASFDLIASRVMNNEANGPGGGIVVFAGSDDINVFNCVIRDNRTISTESVSFAGGGIWASGPSELVLRIANTLLADNFARYGGGMFVEGMQLEMRNCTVAKNIADPAFPNSGGGVWLTGPGTSLIANSIFWGNTAAVDPQQIDIAIGAVSLTVRFSDVQSGWSGIGNILLDPLFFGGQFDASYALMCDSPCLDKGFDGDIAVDLVDVDGNDDSDEDSPWDVLGNPREVNSVAGPSTMDVDMGAFEGFGSSACPGDANHDGIVDVDDLLTVITSWGPCVPTGSTGCLGDVVGTPCGSGAVDVDDLLAVITGWGPCPDGIPLDYAGPVPQSVQQCLDGCSRRHRPETERWCECVSSCVLSIYMTP